MALRNLAVLVLCVALPAGCGKQGGIGAEAVQALLKRGPRAGAAAEVSRADLEKAGVPLMRLTVPAMGIDGFAALRDSSGGVDNWGTADGFLFTLRDGVLIETRGLGADLMSSAMPGAARIAGGKGHRRSYFSTGPDDRIVRRDLACTIRDAGSETLQIHGRAHATRHLIETCIDIGASDSLRNDYWFEGRNLRKAREWVSERIGHVELTRVID